MDDLVKRLRAKSFRFVSRKDYRGAQQYDINPDGPEAAEAITALQSQLAERDALIADLKESDEHWRERSEIYRKELAEARAAALEEAAEACENEADEWSPHAFKHAHNAANRCAATIRNLKEQTDAG